MVVTYIYRSKEPREEHLISTSSEDIRDVVDLVTVEAGPAIGSEFADAINAQKSPSYVAIHTPCHGDAKSWGGLDQNDREE
ncbi:unnamed protein product [Phytophthora fragariaefolia]|uniref:Unnamed protein product n=1 Tax=Phytophthora fragariaefolia TaxID=1490495 RepID=A0A9W6Y123_9STRA|nr:unnamed protein product [Phytophthora fragariaefolia]